MHGVKRRVKSSEEVEKERKRAEIAKIEDFQTKVTSLLSKRSAPQLSEEALQSCTSVLDINPEFYTAWNYRREILQDLDKTMGAAAFHRVLENEMKFTEKSIAMNPKSYWSWLHRTWVSSRLGELCNWNRELALCTKLLALDNRNFHCWHYRKYVTDKSRITTQAEFDFTTKKIGESFSNYSAWHTRSYLFPQLYGSESATVKQALGKEFELVRNAFYTEPNDQSAWFYHKWLVEKSVSLLPAPDSDTILRGELTMCEELLQLESNSKWPLLTSTLLLIRLRGDAQRVEEQLQTLSETDLPRQRYYQDMLQQLKK